MAYMSLTQRILATCRGREFNTIEELASEIPEATYGVVEDTTIRAIRRGLLRGRICRKEFLDGPVVTVSGIRG